MNTETGHIYRGEDEIAAARARGEPIALVSERVARLMEAALGQREGRSTGPRKRPDAQRKKRKRARK